MELIDEVIRSKRRTLSICVTADGLVKARAPQQMPLERIHKFAVEKKDWIESRKRSFLQKKQDAPVRNFVDGETFLFKGQPYKLQFIAAEEAAAPIYFKNAFVISDAYQSKARQLMLGWYEMKAEEVLSDRVKVYADAFDIHYAKIRIADSKRQWGSCNSKGHLSFCWKLVMCPLRIVDYVVAHELAHRREMNHSPAFWALVENMRPDYKDSRVWLKENDHLLKI